MACDERRIIRYLAGDLDGDAKMRFEQHVIVCDECWAAITEDRRGREYAERLRSVAPSSVRDRVRASIELSPGEKRRSRRRPLKLGAGVLAASLAVATSMLLSTHHANDPAIVTEV